MDSSQYLGRKYSLVDEYEKDLPAATAISSGATPESSMAAAGAMKANPYLLGGSFLLSYLKAKQEQFEKKKQLEMQNAANYANDQEAAMNSLNQTWKSALLK